MDQEFRVAIGHCRLSIIDLSSKGHQPMSYGQGRYWITYNGEIYNFKELRTELEHNGHKFFTNSDTEVILASYVQWGSACVKRFRGMFAFALVDRYPSKGGPALLLARDRLGIKPLLYFERGSEIWFASELRGLLASGCFEPRLDPEALLDYLAVGAVFQPRTILDGVQALPAGHLMEIHEDARKLIKYWNLHEETSALRRELKYISEREAVERLKLLLEKATSYHLVSDVPVGAFLSGGIDSTAVVGLMERVSGQQIKTFSVGFEGKYRTMDERFYARLAAKHLHTSHTEVVVTDNDAAEIFPKVVSDLDQPSIDGTNTWIVSRAARSQVKVTLSGLGGDELFAGYQHFFWVNEDTGNFANGFPFGRIFVQLIHKLKPNPWTLRLLFKLSKPAQRLALLRRILDDEEIKREIRLKWRIDFNEKLTSRHSNWLLLDADAVQQMSYAEINGYLVSTLLRDGDAMSMAHGLEVRPVLLDHPLVEFSYSLPGRLKLLGKEAKRVFISAVSEYLPPDLRARPKMGFELPFVGWMAGELKPRFEMLLQTDTAQHIFQKDYLNRTRQVLHRNNPPRALWAWGILLAWLEENRIRMN
jgi:asparagine synthase (glutamine-hydrolysing)